MPTVKVPAVLPEAEEAVDAVESEAGALEQPAIRVKAQAAAQKAFFIIIFSFSEIKKLWSPQFKKMSLR